MKNWYFCHPCEEHRQEDIYEKFDFFFWSDGLELINCFEICRDGAIAITGEYVGFKSFCAAGNDHVTFIHCLIHWELLVTEQITMKLNDVLPDAVKIINFVKNRALGSRLFSNLCKVRLQKFNITAKSKIVVKEREGLRKLLLLKITALNYYKLLCFSSGKIPILLFFSSSEWLIAIKAALFLIFFEKLKIEGIKRTSWNFWQCPG